MAATVSPPGVNCAGPGLTVTMLAGGAFASDVLALALVNTAVFALSFVGSVFEQAAEASKQRVQIRAGMILCMRVLTWKFARASQRAERAEREPGNLQHTHESSSRKRRRLKNVENGSSRLLAACSRS